MNKLQELKAENARLRTENENLKKVPGHSKAYDRYHKRAVNKMVDFILFLEK